MCWPIVKRPQSRILNPGLGAIEHPVVFPCTLTMGFLSAIPALIRVLIVFSVILFCLHRKLALGHCFHLGAFVSGILYGMHPTVILLITAIGGLNLWSLVTVGILPRKPVGVLYAPDPEPGGEIFFGSIR